MDLHQLDCFLAVVDHDSVSAAARTLGKSQPTVTQAVQALERDLDVLLFNRIGRRMVLTSAGHALVGPARRLIRNVHAIEAFLPGPSGLSRGNLDILTHPVLSLPVAQLVGTFRRTHPGVTVRIGDLRDDAVPHRLIREGRCELVVCHLPVPHVEDLVIRVLGTSEAWAVLPPGTPLPGADPIPLTELTPFPLVVVPSGGLWSDDIARELLKAGVRRRPSAIVEQREARMPFVFAGIGGTVFDRTTAAAAKARGAVVRATDPPIRRDYAVLFDATLLSPAGRAFLDFALPEAA